jgi:hypothetical protein
MSCKRNHKLPILGDRIDCVVAQLVSRLPLPCKGRIRSQASPCVFRGGQISLYFGFPLSVSIHQCSILVFHSSNTGDIILALDRVLKYNISLSQSIGQLKGSSEVVRDVYNILVDKATGISVWSWFHISGNDFVFAIAERPTEWLPGQHVRRYTLRTCRTSYVITYTSWIFRFPTGFALLKVVCVDRFLNQVLSSSQEFLYS